MALVLKDRVKETTTSTGTGTITLAGAAGPFQAFSVLGNGSTTYYAIAGQTSSEWEVGLGTYTTSGNTLSRDTVLSSSNSGSLVDFSAGIKDVFCTYPSEKAIYEQANGETLINDGPITVVGSGVTSIPSLPAELGKFIGDVNSFAQIYTLNQSDGATASADFVAYNDLTTDGYTYFTDMGISSSNYTSVDYPIFTPNSGYVFHQGGDFFIGNQTTNKDVVIFSGGVDVTDVVATFSGTDLSASFEANVNVGANLDVTGNTTFGGTVTLDADPTLALQAATKQYVDQIASAGLHIHEPVLVESTANLTATYAQGGTTFNITDITGGNTVTTSTTHGLAVGDQIWLYTSAGNGLLTNTPYYVYSIPSTTQLTLSLTYGGAQLTGLTNATGLTYATRANSGVGATLTNSGTQVALSIDNVALSLNDRVMVRLQTNGFENGVYYVTTVGSGSTNWVLTRATDSNKVAPEDTNGVGEGDYYYTQDGDLNAGDSHVLTTPNAGMILGYTALTFTQFSGAVTYVGGTNIDVAGQTISLTGTVAATNGGTGVNTVTTGDLLYGSASNTWSKLGLGSAYKSLVVNAGGTQVEWNAVALDQSAAISGALGATNGGTAQSSYATGDTLYASASNTLSKLSGNTSTTKQFLSQTGTGSASQAPSWASLSASDIQTGTLGATLGGTGQSSYAVGDLLYADTTTSLAKLADVATGNVLLSGGVGAAPAWGKVALASAVSGTLGISNGGTGQTTANAAFNALAPSQTSNSGKYLTTDGTDASWATIPAGTTFSAGTTGFTPSTATSGTVTLAGTLNIANGGTGQTTRQAAMDALAGATTSGYYLRGDGTDVVMSAIQAGDVPTLNQNTTGTAGNVSGVVAIVNGGTGATSAAAALSALGAYPANNPSGYTNNTGTVTSITAGTYLTGGTITSSGTLAVDATTTNTASKVVARDASGDFSAGTITANLSGSATTFTSTTQNSQFASIGVNTAASGTAGEIRATNNITAYYSDDRFKTNLGNIPEALAKVLSLNGFYYEANELAQSYGYEKKLEVGVSAQQVQAIMPEVVAPAPIDENFLTVRYERLVPLLIEAIKELKAEIDLLKGK